MYSVCSLNYSGVEFYIQSYTCTGINFNFDVSCFESEFMKKDEVLK